MDSTFTAKKAKLLRQLQCTICLSGAKEARLCPHCSGLFCNKCIRNWINSKKAGSCPKCRVALRYDALVNGRSINEVQESITQLMSCMDRNLCDKHKQHLALFCYSCEVNICANCWFSPDHAEHKEQVVPLGEAYEHYRQTLKTIQDWANERKQLIHKGLKQVAANQNLLNSDSQLIEKICERSAKLITGEASSAALTSIRSFVEIMTNLRSLLQHDTEPMRIGYGHFMLEPIVLVFGMPDFSKIIQEERAYELDVEDSNGFEWKCKVFEKEEKEDENGHDEEVDNDNEDDDENAEEGNYSCCLSLIKGKPSNYLVTFGNQLDEVVRFKLDKEVLIGCFQPDVVNDTCRVTIEIRQSYIDRMQQMQNHIDRLEKQCANQMSVESFLSESKKSMGPSSH